MTLTEYHDRLLAEMPEGANHDEAECPICLQGGNTDMSDTFSQAEVDALVQAAVAQATAALQTELDEFKNSEEAKAVEARIAEARTESDAQLAELQTKLDEAVLSAETASKESEAIRTWLDDEAKKAEAEAEQAARRDERIAKVSEVASFPEDYVEENADRWSALDDEAFEALLGDYAKMAEKVVAAKTTTDSKVPAMTAMKAAREDEGGKTPAYADVFALRNAGIDPRSV